MHASHLFEYAVIRIVPRVEREEFLNAGIVVYCREQGFLRMKFRVDEERLTCFSPAVDCAAVQHYLVAFEKICDGSPDSGPIGSLDIASRFRWLTAMRSTVVQTSRVHPGLCENAEEVLEKLFEKHVL